MMNLVGLSNKVNEDFLKIVDKMFSRYNETFIIEDAIKNLFELRNLINIKLILLLAIQKQDEIYIQTNNDKQGEQLEVKIQSNSLEDMAWDVYDVILDYLNNDKIDDVIENEIDNEKESINDIILSDISTQKRHNEILKQICGQFNISYSVRG